MGRQANAVDWTEERSGLLRVIADSEIRIREHAPRGDEAPADDEEPTRPVPSPALFSSYEEQEPLSARGTARLSALADWLAAEESAGEVVSLVREFLRGMDRVRDAVGDVVAASVGGGMTSGLEAAVSSLALSVGMWRGNMIDQVDDLALSDHGSLCGWSSVPEYSCAYALAFLEPAVSDARAWAIASGGDPTERVTRIEAIDALGARIRELNAALRAAIEAAPRRSSRPVTLGAGAAMAW